MAAQPAGAGEGERAQLTLIYAASYSLDKIVTTAPYRPIKFEKKKGLKVMLRIFIAIR